MSDDPSIKQVFNLCGTRERPCCPELREHEDGSFSITDDYGGKTVLNRLELVKLSQVLANLVEVG